MISPFHPSPSFRPSFSLAALPIFQFFAQALTSCSCARPKSMGSSWASLVACFNATVECTICISQKARADGVEERTTFAYHHSICLWNGMCPSERGSAQWMMSVCNTFPVEWTAGNLCAKQVERNYDSVFAVVVLAFSSTRLMVHTMHTCSMCAKSSASSKHTRASHATLFLYHISLVPRGDVDLAASKKHFSEPHNSRIFWTICSKSIILWIFSLISVHVSIVSLISVHSDVKMA